MDKPIPHKTLALAIILVLVCISALIPNILRESTTGWLRSELYFTIFTQILLFVGIFFYVRRNIFSPHWQRKYLLNIFVGCFLLFYTYGSTFYDASFPTLGALFIYSMVFIFIMSITDLVVTLWLPKNKKN